MDAEEDVSRCDVIIFFGPPHAGKTTYYWKHLSKSHQRVCPEEEFNKTPDLSLRQLILGKVVSKLRDGQKVVVDDENWGRAKRDSYLTLIRRKIPACRLMCIKFKAQHGNTQLFWSREYQVAESFELDPQGGSSRFQMSISDLRIHAFYSNNGEDSDNGDMENPESPSEDEGFKVKEITSRLSTQACFKLEIPTMLIQWEGVAKQKGGEMRLAHGAAHAIGVWYNTNPCGRVVIIHDGQGGHRSNVSEEEGNIRYILKELCKELDVCPVYLFHVENSSESGLFTEPPHPGILACLNRLHHIDVTHKASMYLHQTIAHEKMAEAAGLKHIKATRVFEHPNLAKSSHGTKVPPEPPVLSDLQVLPPLTDDRKHPASVPLYKEATESTHCLCSQSLGYGRVLYLCAKDQEILKKYQELYIDNVSPVEASTSKIGQLSRQSSQPASMSSTPTQREPTQIVNVSMSEKTRGLPKWMQPKEKEQQRRSPSGSRDSSGQSSLEDPAERPRTKPSLKAVGSSTVYIMNETELRETAKLILQEAGKEVPTEEEIAEHLSLQEQEGSSQSLTATLRNQEERNRERSSESERRKETRTRESRKHQQLLDEILGGSDEDTQIRAKTSPRRPKRPLRDKGTLCSSPEGENDDPGDILEDILGGGDDDYDASAKRKRPPKRSRMLDESFVPDTSSSGKSSGSTKPSITVDDSLVANTSSEKSLTSSGSRKPSITVDDSLVANTSSDKSLTSSGSRKPSITVDDSLVTNTSSEKSETPPKPNYTLPETLVAETITTIPETKSPRLSLGKSVDTRSLDRSRDESDPSDNARRRSDRSINTSGLVPDSFVPETVTTVPETAESLLLKRQESTTGASIRRPAREPMDTGPDLSVLDDII